MIATHDRIREPLPIEQLLVWAYANQMVHEATRTPIITRSKGPLAAYSSLWSEGGTPVDSSASAGFGAADDAWAIHDAVMKLERITIDCGQDLAAARYHALPQYRGAEPPLGGVVRDKTARGATSLRAWPTNGLLNIDVRTLVVLHALKATRPDMPAPIDVRFKPGQMVRKKNNSGIYARGWFAHVTAVGNLPGHAREAAEIYGAWRKALAHLRQQMQATRLSLFLCTDALPPEPGQPRGGA